MEGLIARVAERANLDNDTARKAIATMLNFLVQEGPKHEVDELLDAIPHAREVMAAEAGAPAKASLLGGLLGAMGGGGGLMALAGKLTALGLNMSQMKTVGKVLFRYASRHVGEEKLKDIAAKTPGLSQMV